MSTILRIRTVCPHSHCMYEKLQHWQLALLQKWRLGYAWRGWSKDHSNLGVLGEGDDGVADEVELGHRHDRTCVDPAVTDRARGVRKAPVRFHST